MSDAFPKRMLVGLAWAVAGGVSGTAVAFALLIAIELAAAVTHPLPEGFRGTKEAMCALVARYPWWVLALVVPAWGLTTFAGVWAGRRIGGPAAALFVAVLLTAGVVLNVSMLTYAPWFEVLSVVVVVVGAATGFRAR